MFLLTSVVCGLCLGSVNISLDQLWQAMLHQGSKSAQTIFWYVRLPRTLAALFAGGALAVSGAVLQGVLANNLASPNIIGVNAGAGLGVTLSAALGLAAGWGGSVFAFMGSCVAVIFISVFASKNKASKSTVILTGVAINSILNAASESIAVLDSDVAALSAEFRVGGFSGIVYPKLIPAMVLIGLGFIVLMTMTVDLDVMLLGDETARSLGVNIKKSRIVFLILAALLAGAAVSFAGLLGFVGLIVPHFVRMFTGSESKKLVPMSAVYGAALVTACDTAARVIFAPFELPVGIIMSVIGGPFFVYLLVKNRGGRSYD